MSSVLRRKIESAAGLPPSLVRCKPFWHKLLANVNNWADDAFGADAFFALETRRVCRGALASKLLSKFEVALFDPAASPGLRAVAVDDRTLTRLAARKLGVEADDIEAAPMLLKRLLFAKAVEGLWTGLSSVFPDGGREGPIEPAVGEHHDPQLFEASGNYLFVNVASGQADEALLVSVVLPLSYLLSNLDRLGSEDNKTLDPDPIQKSTLETAALDAKLRVEAVLGHLEFKLAELYHLDVGEVIVLNEAKGHSIDLEVETLTGRLRLGQGNFGAAQDRRAIRLHSVSNPDKIQSGLVAGISNEAIQAGEAAI